MTCWNHAPILSPGLAAMTADDVVPAAPQIKEVLVTSVTGLLVEGARRPSSEPLALPLTEIFYSVMLRVIRESKCHKCEEDRGLTWKMPCASTAAAMAEVIKSDNFMVAVVRK